MPIFNMTGGGTSLKCETGTIYIDSTFKVNTTLKKITHYSFVCDNTKKLLHGLQYIAVSDGLSVHTDSGGSWPIYSNKDVESTSLENGVFTLTLSGSIGTGYYYNYILIGE